MVLQDVICFTSRYRTILENIGPLSVMLILIYFTMSQLAHEEAEIGNWPFAMSEIARSQVYSIHIIFGTGPGIFPTQSSHA